MKLYNLKLLHIFVLACMFHISNKCQAQTRNVLVKYKDIIEFIVPDNLEVRNENSIVSEYIDSGYKVLNINTPDIALQPVGTNDNVKETHKEYARILIHHVKGDYMNNSEFGNLTKDELVLLETSFQYELQKSQDTLAGFQIIERYPIETIKVNGKNCIKGTYIRKGASNQPLVLVQVYKFFSSNDHIELTLSFRIKDQNKWSCALNKFLQSFQFLK